MLSALVRAPTIQRKLSLILLLTVGVALLLAGLLLVVLEGRQAWRNAHSDLVTHAEVIGLASEAALAFGDAAVGEQTLRVLQAQPNVVAAALYGPDGQLFASFRAPWSRQALVPPQAPTPGVHFDLATATALRPLLSNGELIGSAYVQTRHGLVEDLAGYLGWVGLILLASLFAALLLAQRLQRTLTEPIQEVSEVAQAVLKRGSFERRASKRSEDEVGHLVDAFNAMLDELGQRARVLQEANRALSASEARYQLAARGSSAGLWDWDMEADTMFYSPRLKAALGYSDAEFPDRPDSLRQHMHPDDRAAMLEILRNHLAHDAPYQAECRLQDKDGNWRWFLVTGMALKGPEGKPYRMAGSLIDITERKQSELLLQQANTAKDAFLATLAHELRNPLAPLRTGLQILKNPGAAEAIRRRTLETMDRQLTHMVRLIDDLLDISRINSGKIRLDLARTSLRRALQTALELARPAMDAAGHALQVDLPAADIELMGDDTRLAQAFGNLLNNAARYTPPGGQIRLRAWQAGGEALVEVQDNGVGIPPAMLDQVFNLFAQVESDPRGVGAGGLGIGLFLVRSLVELHGGSVRAQSAGLDRGSTFLVRLPCLPAAETPARLAEGGACGQPSASPARVLVVDDNADAAETLATFLEMLGMQTRTVHDGEGVLGAARAFAPDVVLLDIGLPGKDGYEVARELRGQSDLARAYLVALTGWGSEKDRRRAMEAGFDHHLTKPVDLGVLEELLRRLQTEQRT